MAKKTETVEMLLDRIEHPRRKAIDELRHVILGALPGISEHIKWNAPSFCFKGDDRVTMRLHPGNMLQLIFHRGAKVKDATAFNFDDSDLPLKWLATDRGVLEVKDDSEIASNAAAIKMLVKKWLLATTE